MFQPETEDMLPRLAPKPSAEVLMNGAQPMTRPEVPEVSILFGTSQTADNQQMAQRNMPPQTQQTTSYATWKKQILPKVTFPPGLTSQDQQSSQELMRNVNTNQVNDYNLARCTLYPLRAAAVPVVSMALGGNVNSNVYMGANGNAAGYNSGNNANAMSNPSCYRRSLDSCDSNINHQLPQSYRRPVETTPLANSDRDVLTICAGTQTDALSTPPNALQNGYQSDGASKQDVDDIRQIVREIRHDQLRLMQILETFVFSQYTNTAKAQGKDAAVQVRDDEIASPAVTNGCCTDSGIIQPAAPTNKFIEHLKPPTYIRQTPKGKPMAQSTTYRPNTPATNRLQERQQISSPPPAQQLIAEPVIYQQTAAAVPNTVNDKSSVMNELALKYLPNDKLMELLKELNIAPPSLASAAQKQISETKSNTPSAPLRNVENFERNPTDISNASYKYLKKYRLLPEDNSEDVENENTLEAPSPGQQYDNLRNSPDQHRQQINDFLAKTNSPYQQQMFGRMPPSPLVRASTPPQQYRDMLNLENIKQQPKFL